jgi:hypothetical protein
MGGAKRSPLLERRSLSHHLDLLEVSFDDLRRAGKSAGVTLNDAFLAGLTGGLRRYHERLGMPIDTIQLGIAVSIRREDPIASNRFTGIVLAAPVGVADPGARMERIHTSKCWQPARSRP